MMQIGIAGSRDALQVLFQGCSRLEIGDSIETVPLIELSRGTIETASGGKDFQVLNRANPWAE